MIATLNILSHNQTPKQLGPMTLAFVGDAAYELLAREYIVSTYGTMPPSRLHQRTVLLVKAGFQARVYDLLAEQVTEEEADYLRRGRNSSSIHPPKNANMVEYRKATGVETLFGFLYVSGQIDRINTLFEMAVTALKEPQTNEPSCHKDDSTKE